MMMRSDKIARSAHVVTTEVQRLKRRVCRDGYHDRRRGKGTHSTALDNDRKQVTRPGEVLAEQAWRVTRTGGGENVRFSFKLLAFHSNQATDNGYSREKGISYVFRSTKTEDGSRPRASILVATHTAVPLLAHNGSW